MIVLVNDQTSGTAEIMAQDLQENANAIIIGTHTADKVDMTGTTEITGLDHRSIWFTYPLIDFLSSNGLPLQQLGGVQFAAQDILLKANEDALNRAIEYLKIGK